MARKKKAKRETKTYLDNAKYLSKFVPSLKKYRKRKTLTRYEKSAIARREKQLLKIPDLIPVTKQQARKLGRKKMFAGGVQAIQLRGVSDTAKIRIKGPDIEVIDGAQRWIYWSLDRKTVRSRSGMRGAGKSAFDKQFPIEKLSDLSAHAFKSFRVQEVRLWAHAGIVGEGFNTIEQFIMWVNEKWQNGRYVSTRVFARSGDIYSSPSDPGKWVNGIAILIENPEYTQKRKELENEEKAQNKKLGKRTKRKI